MLGIGPERGQHVIGRFKIGVQHVRVAHVAFHPGLALPGAGEARRARPALFTPQSWSSRLARQAIWRDAPLSLRNDRGPVAPCRPNGETQARGRPGVRHGKVPHGVSLCDAQSLHMYVDRSTAPRAWRTDRMPSDRLRGRLWALVRGSREMPRFEERNGGWLVMARRESISVAAGNDGRARGGRRPAAKPVRASRKATKPAAIPQQNEAAAKTAPVDDAGHNHNHLDRLAHGWLARLTGGLSPAALAAAHFDWASHLALSPGKQQELGHKAVRQWLRWMTQARKDALGEASEPAIEPLPQDRRFVAEAWHGNGRSG